MREGRGTHSDARTNMHSHHEEVVAELFAGYDKGELTDEQAQYLLLFSRFNRGGGGGARGSGSMYREYLRAFGGAPCDDADRAAESVCSTCGKPQRYDQREQLLVCTQCGVCAPESAITMPLHSTEDTTVVPQFTYKKVNHFREWLAQCQARETTDVSETIAALGAELRKRRKSDEEQQRLSPADVRSLLRELRLGNYDHVHLIHATITGRQPPQFDHETEMRLVEMFKATLAPFENVRGRVCPTRVNFLSYSYVLRKLTAILGIGQIDAHYFPLLKSREKLYTSDCVWRAICAELGWPFERSM